MADKEFELDDPFQPVAVSLPTPGYDGLEAMARCFVEEYALMGWPPERVFKLFTIPDFAASYSILQERGADYVKQIIASVMGEQSIAAIEAARVTELRRRPAPATVDGRGMETGEDRNA
jgi:hypothetical protein